MLYYGYTTRIDKPWVIIGTGNWFLQKSTKQLLVPLLADQKEPEEHATGNWMKIISE